MGAAGAPRRPCSWYRRSTRKNTVSNNYKRCERSTTQDDDRVPRKCTGDSKWTEASTERYTYACSLYSGGMLLRFTPITRRGREGGARCKAARSTTPFPTANLQLCSEGHRRGHSSAEQLPWPALLGPLTASCASPGTARDSLSHSVTPARSAVLMSPLATPSGILHLPLQPAQAPARSNPNRNRGELAQQAL